MPRKPILKIGGDSSEARRAIREVKDDARDFARIRAEASVVIREEAARARLQMLEERLQRLGRQEVSPRVTIAMARTLEQIDRLKLKLDALGAKDVTVDVDVKRGAGERLAGSLSTIVRGASSVLSSLPGVGGLFGALASGATSLGSGGVGAAAGLAALAAASAALFAGVVLLVPVIVSLGASLIAAAAGAGILALALGGALLGPIGLGIAAVAKLVSIFQALGQEEKNRQANTLRAQAAAQQEATAHQALADALRNEAEQFQAAGRAQQDAERAVPRDRLSVRQARTEHQQAVLDAQKARQALLQGVGGDQSLFRRFSDVGFDPSQISPALFKQASAGGSDLKQLLLDVQKAEESEKSTTFALSDAKRKLNQDRQTEADFVKKGLRAYQPYDAALRQVASAQASVASATRAATSAQDAQNKGLETLTPRERRLATALKGIKDRFEEAFGPAVDNALSGIVKAVGGIAKAFESPRVRQALRSLGTAVGESFARLGRFLADPANQQALVQFLNAGRRLVRPLTDLFVAFAKVVRDTARDALPRLISGVRRFAGEVTSWEKHQGGAKNLRKTVGTLIDSFNDWVKITKGLALILLAFLRGAKGTGDSFAGTLGDVLVKWGKFLNTRKGQQGIVNFFHDIRIIVRDLVIVLEHMVKVIQGATRAAGLFKKAWDALPKDGQGGVKDAAGSTPLGQAFGLGRAVIKKFFGLQTGGLVPGSGRGDHIPLLAEPGEFVLRRAIVNAVGLPRLQALNAGVGLGNGSGIGGTRQVHQHFHGDLVMPGFAPRVDPDYDAVRLWDGLAKLGAAVVP